MPDPKISSASELDERERDTTRAEDAAASGEHAHVTKRTPDSSYQNYLFGRAGAGDAPAWSDSAKGRFAIRMVSRGLVGATFFVVGGRMATSQLKGYNQETWKWNWEKLSENKPLQAIAKGFDATLGRGIEKTMELFSRAKHGPEEAAAVAKRAVTFRESREFKGSGFPMGRSYGADVVGFTFDFAMASIGDASARNVIQALDPNLRKSWLVNDAGDPAARSERKHFLPGEWLKSTAKSTWRVLSKNQGEDWAAAIPYAFQMKFQRQFLSNAFSKRWDGHKLVFDHSWNGGAYKVNPQGQIIGDFQLAGAIDLHARFVGYNWYTLMFREGYDTIGNAMQHWKDNGYKINLHMPEHLNPLTAAVDGVGQAARYVTKSFIKANMYMNPAVIPFWIMRVPQSKWRGKYFVEEGAEKFTEATKRTHIWSDGVAAGEKVLEPFARSNYEHYPTASKMDKFEKGFSQFLSPFGWFSNKVGTGAANLGEKIAGRGWEPKSKFINSILKDDKGRLVEGRRKFMHEVTDASLSYTPYMWAKAETALRVDDSKGDGKPGQMDSEIYRFIDDVTSFNFKDMPRSVKHMWKLGTNFEREISAHEGEPVNTGKADTRGPTTTVHADGLTRHDPVSLDRVSAPAANEKSWAADVDGGRRADDKKTASNDATYDADHRWAKAVVGSDINPARMQPSSATRH